MKFYKHQQELIDRSPKKHGLWWSVGSGKTLASITLCENNGGSTLIVCPKSLKEQWEEQIVNHKDWLVLTKEQFKKNVSTLSRYDNLIFDECHYASNYKSQIGKATIMYCNYYKPNTYLLTGTPYLSSSWNVYTYLLIMGKNIPWYKWSSSFFTKVKMGNRYIPIEKTTFNGKPMSEVMGDFLREIGNFVKLEDCFDVPEQVDQKELFYLTDDQKKAFDKYYDLTPIVNYTRQLQIANGTIKEDNKDGYITFKSEKFNRTLDIIDQYDKIIIVCRHRAEMDRFFKALQGKRTIYQIHGDIKNRHEIVGQANDSKNCVVLVNASCSEGYELPLFPIMVFYSLSNSHKDHVQMKGRILRANHLKKNVYKYMVVKDCVDELIYKSVVIKKQDFNIELIK